MCMRRRVAPAARARPMVEPTAGGAASYSAVQLRRGPRSARGPSWARGRRCPAEHAGRRRSCGVADGVVNQVGPSGTAHGSSELVKAHTPRRPGCRNSPPGGPVVVDPWLRSGTGPLRLRTRRVSYGEVLVTSWVLLPRIGGLMIQPTWESGEVLQPEASGPRRRPTGFLVRLQA
jgi:hypothetical protein